MADNTTAATTVGIVAIITAVGTAIALICKRIKQSSCCGVALETRDSLSNLHPQIIQVHTPQTITTTTTATTV